MPELSNLDTTLSEFLQVEPPTPPSDFKEVWENRFASAMRVEPHPSLVHQRVQRLRDFETFDLQYFSTDGVRIGGWLTVPKQGPVTRAIIVGHGYGGCPEPTSKVPLSDAVYLWPCLRGLGRSPMTGVPQDPYYHVLYDVDKRDQYILGGCVEDLWTAVTALEKLFPATRNRVGLMGISFSGGIGVLAAAWDQRLRRAHFEVPTFGHHPLRMSLPSHGSAKALQDFHRNQPSVLKTLAYYDAANAAQWIKIPVHIAAALEDPVVTPAGQFAIYNALQSPRSLYVLEKGHSEYAGADRQQQELLSELTRFFADL